MYNQQQNEPPAQRRSPIMIILLISALVLFPLESIFKTTKSGPDPEGILGKILDPVEQVTEPRPINKTTIDQIMNLLENKQYLGTWNKKVPKNANFDVKKIIEASSGKIRLNILTPKKNGQFQFRIKIFNTQYIDQGYHKFILPINTTTANQTILKTVYTYHYKDNLTLGSLEKVNSKSEIHSQFNFTSVKIEFSATDKKEDIKIKIEFESELFCFQTEKMIQYGAMIHNIILSILLTVIANIQLFAALKILKQIMLGQESAEKYSLVSFLLITMWDCAIMFITFSLSLESDDLLIIYIAPMFLSTILFTSIQMKLLVIIYSAENNHSQTNQIKFQFVVYGCLVCTYPLLTYFNYSQILFLVLPFISLPQIYKNAMRGQRIKLESNFLRVYLPRFFFILYLRGYSKNLYDLRPNYPLCIAIILLVGLSVLYLFLQERFGSRFLIPKILLPKKYEYFTEQRNFMNEIQEGITSAQDCAICISPLHIQPLVDDFRMNNEVGSEYIGKIMKTPCNHHYHGYCLIKWMSHKMECPTCRAKLPSLQ